MAATRTLTLWCPDWPLVALGIAAGDPNGEPAAVLLNDVVLACSAAARTEGVRRGHRRREAQQRCPDLLIRDRDEVQEARVYEPVLQALDAVSPAVEVIRPGLCVFASKGPARYFGGDEALARRAVEAVSEEAEDGRARVGIADGRFTSVLAARHARHSRTGNTVVPPGRSAAFLAEFPVTALDRPDLADLFGRLGIRTLGDLAALPAKQVASRFGAEGTLAHRHARGLDEVQVVARECPPDLAVTQELDPPIETLEPLAFVAKMLADTLAADLAARALTCTRVRIEAETEHGERHARLWRQDGPLTANAIAQRVRWQLAGWLTGPAPEQPSAGMTLLRITPDEVRRDDGQQLSLFGDESDADRRAAAALTRLQGLLGFDAVLVPVPSGGRDPAGYTQLVPWGEPRPAAWTGDPPWPGRLPTPTPTVLYADPLPAALVDASGTGLRVDDRGELSADPCALSVRGARPVPVKTWAGPWPVDESARMQVVTADGIARLLVVRASNWYVEGAYL